MTNDPILQQYSDRDYCRLLLYCGTPQASVVRSSSSSISAAAPCKATGSSMGTCSSSLKKRTSTVHDVDHAGAAVGGKKGADTKAGKNKTGTELAAGNGISHELLQAEHIRVAGSSRTKREARKPFIQARDKRQIDTSRSRARANAYLPACVATCFCAQLKFAELLWTRSFYLLNMYEGRTVSTSQ